MLEPVHAQARLVRRKAAEHADVQVVVDAAHVGPGVVHDVVLLLPDEGAGAHRVDAPADRAVDVGRVRVAAVVGVVHHAHADGRDGESQRHREQRRQPRGQAAEHGGREDQQGPRCGEPGEDDGGFAVHLRQVAAGRATRGKMGVDAGLEFAVEGTVVAEADARGGGRGHAGSMHKNVRGGVGERVPAGSDRQTREARSQLHCGQA